MSSRYLIPLAVAAALAAPIVRAQEAIEAGEWFTAKEAFEALLEPGADALGEGRLDPAAGIVQHTHIRLVLHRKPLRRARHSVPCRRAAAC